MLKSDIVVLGYDMSSEGAKRSLVCGIERGRWIVRVSINGRVYSARANSLNEAIGQLVSDYPDEFDLEIEVTDPDLEDSVSCESKPSESKPTSRPAFRRPRKRRQILPFRSPDLSPRRT